MRSFPRLEYEQTTTLINQLNSVRVPKLVLLMIFMLFFTTQVFSEQHTTAFGKATVEIGNKGYILSVEVASTEKQRSIGLMYREHLDLSKGMLFVFEYPALQRVWMKNTLIPLDVLFVSANGEIVSILKSLQPCVKKSCEIYDSVGIAKYMLEVNAGVVEKQKLKVGMRVFLFL
ncbi:MAG: DUF192 domain-containing protein [Methylococcaceae bacterium]|nr:DUF192 domain-containing protein [Methylococcaceae bacterium]